MNKDIAKKSLMNLWVRILMVMVVGVYIIIPKKEYLFDIVTYLMIAYGAVTLILVVHQIFQPKVLISIKDGNLNIHGVFKSIVLTKDEIKSYVIKEQSNRGYVHTYGKVIINTINTKKITIYNVKDISEVKEQLKIYLNQKSI
ncbi:MAG: hypothetical protein WC008_01680 [Bacilli bacterium]